MGRKPTGKRQHLLFYVARLLIMMLWIAACSHVPQSWQTRQNLSQAKALLANGHYQAALGKTQQVLSSDPGTKGVEALYLMGIIYAHPQNPNSSLERSLESFHILVKKYPESELTREAEAWISTLRKIKKMDKEILELKDQIDKLKEIDLGIEEKKRRELPRIEKMDEEILELKDQIDKLKEIDLGIEEKKRRESPRVHP